MTPRSTGNLVRIGVLALAVLTLAQGTGKLRVELAAEPAPTPAPAPAPQQPGRVTVDGTITVTQAAPAPTPAPTPAPEPTPAPTPTPAPEPTPAPTPAGYHGRLVALYVLGAKPSTGEYELRRDPAVKAAFEHDLDATWTSVDLSALKTWTSNQTVIDAGTRSAPCVLWLAVGQRVLQTQAAPTPETVAATLGRIRTP